MCHNACTHCEPLSFILHLIYEFLMPRGTHFIFFKLAILYWSIVDWVYFSVLSLLFMHQGYDLLCSTLITCLRIWRLNNGSWGRRTCLRSRLLSQLDFKSEPKRVHPLLCCQCTCWGNVTSSAKSPGSTRHLPRECWHVHTRQAPSSCGHTQPPWTVRSPRTAVPTHEADAHTCTSDPLCGGSDPRPP